MVLGSPWAKLSVRFPCRRCFKNLLVARTNNYDQHVLICHIRAQSLVAARNTAMDESIGGS